MHHISYFWVAVNLLDELSHVLTQCFTARPLTLSMAVERMGAGMLLMTVGRERDTHTKRDNSEIVKQMFHFSYVMSIKYTANKSSYFPRIRSKALICHTLTHAHTHAKLTVAADASIQPSESG